MKNRKSVFFRMVFVIFSSMFTAKSIAADGPGMVVSFSNVVPGTTVSIYEAKTASGQPFARPGSLAPGRIPLKNMKTSGGSSDTRELPEWAEFSWWEWEYKRSYTKEELDRAPSYKRRVPIRDRVPQDVVDEVLASNQAAKKDAPPEKYLELIFVWYPGETRVRWALWSRHSGKLRSGGDEMPVID